VTLADAPGRAESLPYPVDRFPRESGLASRMLRLLAHLTRQAGQHDVMFVLGLEPPALAAAKLRGVPAVCKLGGDFAWEQARNRGLTGLEIDPFQTTPCVWKAEALKRLRSSYVRLANRVLTPSEYLRSLAIGWGAPPDRVSVISNALTPQALSKTTREQARQQLGTSGRLVVSVGRMVGWKGFDHLIEALTGMPEDVRLALVGNGPGETRLKALAAERGLAGRVSFPGRLPHAEVELWLRAADVFALYSTYEGLSHVLLEAMGSGASIVASDCGGNPEVIEDGVSGLLVPPARVDLLRGALGRLLGDPEARERLAAAAARRLATDFAWPRLVERTLALLEEVAQEGRKRT
jgi:glycosyltransferase involved in cell wall biosynthesis